MNDNTIKRTKMHEGFRARPYYCTAGRLTIGYGWNIEAFPLPELIAEIILRYQRDLAEKMVDSWLPGTHQMLSENRLGVLTEMVFQLGAGRAHGFKRMWAAVKVQDWTAAAAEMRDSKWYRQDSHNRADYLAHIMETNDV